VEPQQRPSQSNAFKPLPEDDLANFEALVDRMMRHRAEAGLPSRGAQEPLIDAPKITISHPADFRPERRFERPATVVPAPWHVRHARKLIGTGVLVVGAGTAYLAYTNAWRFAPEQANMAAPAVPEPAGPVEQRRRGPHEQQRARDLQPDLVLLDLSMPGLDGLTALPRLRDADGGLYVFAGLGSRGIAWAALGGELLASWISGAPCPLEADLRDALDPARYALRLRSDS